MRTFSRIIVDIDTHATDHPALDRAMAFAQVTGAEVTVVDVITPSVVDCLSAAAEEELLGSARTRLQGLAETMPGAAGLPTVNVKLLFGNPAASLIEEVEHSGADMLVRSHARDIASPSPTPFGPIDRELVRTCPAPVLLVGPGARPLHPRIVGALAADDGRPPVAALNRTIIDFTLLMAAVEDGSPTLLQAWTPFGEQRFRDHGTGEGVTAYIETRRAEVLAGLADDLDAAGANPERVTLAAPRGRVDEVLPAYTVSNGIDLVVIGVSRRRGLARLVIGNTAERVLRRLPCSVLAVKANPS